MAMSLTKRDLLGYLARAGESSAREAAAAYGVRPAVAAMGLLRLVRQGLAARRFHPQQGMYLYRLSKRGEARLAFLERRSGLIESIEPTP